ncbi:MAG: DUF1080 domain-containing protein [Planctomycetia bacterium]|nr:DUF1080 domain-containing protein [Planctomycetia bacterium]
MRSHTRFLAPLVVLVLGTVAALLAAQEKKPAAVIDPAKAGPDFAVQGEYAGEIPTNDGNKKFGIQIIALGDGKYRAAVHHGGLPGDGWDKSERILVDGQEAGGVTTFKADNGTGTIKDGVLSIVNANGNALGDLKKVDRKSPTLGEKPPEGAVVLFDGSTAERFEGGKLTDDKCIQPGITSKQKFQSFKLHMEFLLSYMPTAAGQARSNSGCYLQGRYEVQILDSFGLEGKNNECGGIYEIKDPDVNMCFPPLAWQTYDIDYTAAKYDGAGKKTANARVTVKHNGVVIHENVELPRATRGNPVQEGPEAGPIYIQDHGNPLKFRNIWVVEKK